MAVKNDEPLNLSPEQKLALVRAEFAKRELCRRQLSHFTVETHGNYRLGWVHEDICARLRRFSQQVAEGKSPRLMLLMPPRHGKLLADDTEVYTMRGWTTHGDLRVGDFVLGFHGQWTKVLALGQKNYASVAITFRCGQTVVAHPDHEWYMRYRQRSGERAHVLLETRVLLERRVYDRKARTFLFDVPLPMLTRQDPLDPIPDSVLAGRSLTSLRGASPFAVYKVEEVAPVAGRCIQVDAPDGLYLVTRDLIPTHNSELASTRFPAWHIGHHPHHEIINVGYNMDLPVEFSRKIRALMRSSAYSNIFPDTQLSPDSQSVEMWKTTRGGGFLCAGVGGGITGKGAHILIIDDPIKNQEEANSARVRDGLFDWYQSTAYTRLAPGGGVLIIQTMWHDDDLASRLIRSMEASAEADQFEIIRYPALSTQWEYRDEDTWQIVRSDTELDLSVDPRSLTLLRPPDMCLHEGRYPTDALKRIRSNLQPSIWQALYQQDPVPDGGMYFRTEYFQYYPTYPSLAECSVITACDFAIGEKQQNDFTVVATIAVAPNSRIYVLNVLRFKEDTYGIVQKMMGEVARWSAGAGSYQLGVEDGQLWRAIKPVFESEARAWRVVPPIEALRPATDKQARARPLQGAMQHGRMYFPMESTWLVDCRNEMLRFPFGAHDDMVDALAWAVHLAYTRGTPSPKTPVVEVSWRDKLMKSIRRGGRGKDPMGA